MSSHSGECAGLIAPEQMSHPRSIVSASLGTLGFLYVFCFDCSVKFILLLEKKITELPTYKMHFTPPSQVLGEFRNSI